MPKYLNLGFLAAIPVEFKIYSTTINHRLINNGTSLIFMAIVLSDVVLCICSKRGPNNRLVQA